MVGRQQAKEPLGDKLVTLWCPMSSSAGIRLRAIERHERNVLGFQMANKTGIGSLHADEEFGSVRFDVFLDLVNQRLGWVRHAEHRMPKLQIDSVRKPDQPGMAHPPILF